MIDAPKGLLQNIGYFTDRKQRPRTICPRSAESGIESRIPASHYSNYRQLVIPGIGQATMLIALELIQDQIRNKINGGGCSKPAVNSLVYLPRDCCYYTFMMDAKIGAIHHNKYIEKSIS